MADPGVSGQNFLRLLLGGAQKGVDQIPRQQAQQADLTLALQRMMQQQGQFDESQASLDRRFNEEQERLKANAAANLQFEQSKEGRRGQEKFFDTHQEWIERQNQKAFRDKLIEKYPHLAGPLSVLDAGGTAGMANSTIPDAADDPNVDPTTDPQRLSFWNAVQSRLGQAHIRPPTHEDSKHSIEEFEEAKLDAAITLAQESGWNFMLKELVQKKAEMVQNKPPEGPGTFESIWDFLISRGANLPFQDEDFIPKSETPVSTKPTGPVRAKKAPNAKKQSSTGSNLNPVEQKIASLYEELGINA